MDKSPASSSLVSLLLARVFVISWAERLQWNRRNWREEYFDRTYPRLASAPPLAGVRADATTLRLQAIDLRKLIPVHSNRHVKPRASSHLLPGDSRLLSFNGSFISETSSLPQPFPLTPPSLHYFSLWHLSLSDIHSLIVSWLSCP